MENRHYREGGGLRRKTRILSAAHTLSWYIDTRSWLLLSFETVNCFCCFPPIGGLGPGCLVVRDGVPFPLLEYNSQGVQTTNQKFPFKHREVEHCQSSVGFAQPTTHYNSITGMAIHAHVLQPANPSPEKKKKQNGLFMSSA